MQSVGGDGIIPGNVEDVPAMLDHWLETPSPRIIDSEVTKPLPMLQVGHDHGVDAREFYRILYDGTIGYMVWLQTEHTMKKVATVALGLFASIPPAAAVESWQCIFPGLISPTNVRERMEVRASDVIRDGEMAYRIVENNSRALVATYVRTQPEDAQMAAGTMVIEKSTGHFALSVMVPGSPLASKVVAGSCKKED